jgi:hypothetical protein
VERMLVLIVLVVSGCGETEPSPSGGFFFSGEPQYKNVNREVPPQPKPKPEDIPGVAVIPEILVKESSLQLSRGTRSDRDFVAVSGELVNKGSRSMSISIKLQLLEGLNDVGHSTTDPILISPRETFSFSTEATLDGGRKASDITEAQLAILSGTDSEGILDIVEIQF